MRLVHWGPSAFAIFVAMVVGAGPVSAMVSLELGPAKNTWFYGYYGQLGGNGFFGAYNVDASPGANFAALNGWVGNRRRDTGELASGTNVSTATVDLESNANVGNRWISLKGRYKILTYDIARTQGAYVEMSAGQLSMWAITTITPLGSISYGKRELNAGMGLQFGPTRTSEQLVFQRIIPVPNLLAYLVSGGILPRGAMSWLNPSTWPLIRLKDEGDGKYSGDPDDELFTEEKQDAENLRQEMARIPKLGRKDDDGESDQVDGIDPDRSFRWGYITSGYLTMGFGFYPFQQIRIQNNGFNSKDLNAARERNLLGYLVYSCPDLNIGLGGLYVTFHEGPELIRDPDVRKVTPTKDTSITEGWLFLQYSNGRFFLNSELDWYSQITRYQPPLEPEILPPPDVSGSSYAPDYVESWRFMAEVGIVSGPFSARFMYAFMPGPDRRNGRLIDRQPFIQDDERAAFAVFDPYGILLSSQFGSGVDAGAYISAASVFALKVDYAIAANLVAEASILKARRNSHGYGWGFIRPLPSTTEGEYGTVEYRNIVSAPAIPDNDLGWELTAGVTWQLLEGWTLGARCAYWKPGKWFNYACVDRSVPGWDATPRTNWGVNSNRTIDPFLAVELRFGASY